jgi:hypothetical protein
MTAKQRIRQLEKTKRGAFVPPAKILTFYREGGKVTQIDGVPVGADEASQAQAEKVIANHPRVNGQCTVIEVLYKKDGDE